MSLLMDALRKAEADKKQTATPDEPGGAPGSGAAAVQTSAERQRPDAPHPHGAFDADDEDLAETVDLAVKRSRETEADRGEAVVDETADPTPTGRVPGDTTTRPGDGLALEPLADLELSEDEEDLAETVDLGERRTRESAAVEATVHTPTLPSARAVESELQQYFDDSPSIQHTGTAEKAVESKEPPLGYDGSETVVTAQTVFVAGDGGSSRRALGISMTMVALLAVVLLGAGVFYFQKTPVTRTLPSPLVADTVERSVPKELPIVPIGSPVESDESALVRLEPVKPEPLADEEPAAVEASPLDRVDTVGEAVADRPTPDPGVSGRETVVTPPPATAGMREEVAQTDVPATEPAAVPSETPAAALVEEPAQAPPGRPVAEQWTPVGPGEVRIARVSRSTQPDPRLSSAYASFMAGDLATAQGLYEAVLSGRPGQHDALLGLAAIALHNGDVEASYRYYATALERDPEDPTANAALFMLEGGAGDRVTEGRLKLLLDRGQDVSPIYFALGNLYVRQDRWADAQQAFFNAFRTDSANADYSFNLAVSLDRIGQHEAALDYYQKALALADESGGNFNPAQVLARIQGLAASTGP